MQTALELFFNDQQRYPTEAEIETGSISFEDTVYIDMYDKILKEFKKEKN